MRCADPISLGLMSAARVLGLCFPTSLPHLDGSTLPAPISPTRLTFLGTC